MTVKDFLGQELKVGDEVVFMELGYRNLLRGKIVKINVKTLLIEHGESWRRETKQTSEQVVRINENS
jgi:hypothetical protein